MNENLKKALRKVAMIFSAMGALAVHGEAAVLALETAMAPPKPSALMGINGVLNFRDYTSGHAYANVAKGGRPWQVRNGASTEGHLDEHGYFKSLPEGATYSQSVFAWHNMPPEVEGREFVVTWDGDPDALGAGWSFSVVNRSREATETGGRLRFRVDRLSNGRITARGTDHPFGHVRNVVVYPADNELWAKRANSGEFWSAEFLASWAKTPPAFLRNMDWVDTNNSTVTDFLPSLDHSTWTNGNLPIEAFIQLCNRLDCPAWICTPHQATDGYLRELGRRTALAKPRHKPRVERSNETWNFKFTQAHHHVGEGLRAWGQPIGTAIRKAGSREIILQNPPEGVRISGHSIIAFENGKQPYHKVASYDADHGIIRLQGNVTTDGSGSLRLGSWRHDDWYVKRSVETATVFREGFMDGGGNGARVLPILATQAASSGVTRRRIRAEYWKQMEPENWVDPREFFHAFSSAPYYGGAIVKDPLYQELIQDGGLIDRWEAAPEDDEAVRRVVDYLTNLDTKVAPYGIGQVRDWIRANNAVAGDMREEAYEGGSHIIHGHGIHPKFRRLMFYIHWSSPGAKIWRAYAEMCRKELRGPLPQYRLTGPPDGGLWSMRRHLTDDTPLYREAVAFCQEYEPWWKDEPWREDHKVAA